MDFIKKTIGNAEFYFFVNSRDNRSGFVHECELYLNGEQIAKGKAQYYNRTWEAYRYQSVMLSCVYDAIEQAKRKITEAEKDRRGWSRLTQARKNEIGRIVDENSAIKVLRALRDEVNTARYGTETERRDLECLDALNTVLGLLMSRTEEQTSPAA